MPWEQVWVPNPSDENIPLHKNPPDNFQQYEGWGCKMARRSVESLIEDHKQGKELDHRTYYYCRECKGWIEGKPTEYHEDNIGPLCGRRGTVTACIRCGDEIGFCGMVS